MDKNNNSESHSGKDRVWYKITQGFSVFSIIPIISGIIAPMITYLLPVAYSIYYLFAIPSSDIPQAMIRFDIDYIISMILLFVTFIIGPCILLSIIITMAKEKKKGDQLIQHGIYARIRHPQNLLISLMMFLGSILFGILLYGNILIGYIVSWGFFTLFLQFSSLIEEKFLLKRFPDQYWAYIHRTGFFHFKLGKAQPIPEKSPQNVSKYFKKRIIISVSYFIGLYIIIFTVVKILKFNDSDILEFYNPFVQSSNFYPPFHFINEIVAVLIPIGIWFVSFIFTLIRYLKKRKNTDSTEEIRKDKKMEKI